MLKMAQKDYIKYLWESEALSLREISRRTGVSFETVRKYAYQEDWSRDEAAVIKVETYPVLKEYIGQIDEWLEADKKLPRKQRHTAKRIYERLKREYGYHGSYSSVKRYIHKKKKLMATKAEGYLPLEHPTGHAQVDFGENIYYDSKGQEKKGYELVVSFPYSRKAYVQFFQSQNQECLLTGLQRIFEHIGGVPPRLRFDNMSAVVAQVLEGQERILTDGFERFKLHYRFNADFCNPVSGNEKGNVENKVGYIRRNVFVPIPTITSFEEFNEKLWEWCEKDAQRVHYKKELTIRELWEEERKELLVLPEYEFPIFRYETLSVNKCGFATIDTNKYGLAPTLGGETVQAKIYFDRVEFYYERQLIGKHRRSYGRNEEIYDWRHYVGVLLKKPGAVEHTRFFRQMPERWQALLMQTKGQERKSALQLLYEIVQDGNTQLCDDALELAAENGRTDADSIRQYYYIIAKRESYPKLLTLKSDVPRLNYNPNLMAYDNLMGGERNG